MYKKPTKIIPDFKHMAEIVVYKMQSDLESDLDNYSLLDRVEEIAELLKEVYEMGNKSPD